jgi:hypothetical protein
MQRLSFDRVTPGRRDLARPAATEHGTPRSIELFSQELTEAIRYDSKALTYLRMSGASGESFRSILLMVKGGRASGTSVKRPGLRILDVPPFADLFTGLPRALYRINSTLSYKAAPASVHRPCAGANQGRPLTWESSCHTPTTQISKSSPRKLRPFLRRPLLVGGRHLKVFRLKCPAIAGSAGYRAHRECGNHRASPL